jgi:hypothetical protein
MEQGNILEERARPLLAAELDREIKEVGFITTDDGRIGCSPDGMMTDAGCEIKCSQPPQQVAWLIDGVLPPEHAAQVHGGMYVTGLPVWYFFAYSSLPRLLIRVERDDKIQAVLKEALGSFLEKFDAGWKRLCELGTPPKRMTREELDAAWERAGKISESGM